MGKLPEIIAAEKERRDDATDSPEQGLGFTQRSLTEQASHTFQGANLSLGETPSLQLLRHDADSSLQVIRLLAAE